MKDMTTNQTGMSLVEVTLALGVASISFAAIFGLLPVGLQTNQNTVRQLAAADIVSAVIADLRASPITTGSGETITSPQFAIHIPARAASGITTSTLFFGSEGQFYQSTNPKSQYRLTIRFLPSVELRRATLVHLKMTWPAEATPAHAAGSADMFLGLDRN